MFKKTIFIVALAAFSAHAAKEVRCVCKNGVIQSPYCGICGSDAGSQEKIPEGARCLCDTGDNKLRAGKATCADACASYGGWTGDFD